MTAAIVVGTALLGLAVGSFLNVVIYRVPRKESVVRPRSRCPRCGTQLAERDNIPVLSWLILRGRCRTCREPISARYPLVELLTAALFGVVALRIGWHPELAAFLLFTAALVAVSAIDLELYLIPNRILYPALGASIVLLCIAAAIHGEVHHLADAAISMAIAFAVFFAIHVISPRGLGFGDVRLSALLGLFLGWIGPPHVVVGLFLGFLLGAVVSVTLIASGLRGRKDKIPFGPFLAAGALLGVLVGNPIVRVWLHR